MSTSANDARGMNRLPVSRIQQALLDWYRAVRRDLPWRRTSDPYRIWLSEVMLQQTQVETALPYYDRFLERFPTLKALAAADVDEVLDLWAGLGYYRRARNFHAAVREVATTYGGQVPADPKAFRDLPGVGPYTTGAVMSIAFDHPMPAIDGNVLRVLTRLAGISEPVDRAAGRRRVEDVAERLVPTKCPGDWNQAVMELGAMVCRPVSPRCEECPLESWCHAALDGAPQAFPVTQGRTQVRSIERLVAGVEVGGMLMLVKRPEEGLLAGMWDLPALEGDPGSWLLPGDREAALQRFLVESGFADARVCELRGTASHRFSHVEWYMWVYRCIAASAPPWCQAVPKDAVGGVVTATGIKKALKLMASEVTTKGRATGS